MHAGFAQFAAFDQDAADNKAFLAAGKLDVPVLALGGERSFGATMATVMRVAASEVEEGWSQTPDTGSWKRIRKLPSRWFVLFSTRVEIPWLDCGLTVQPGAVQTLRDVPTRVCDQSWYCKGAWPQYAGRPARPRG